MKYALVLLLATMAWGQDQPVGVEGGPALDGELKPCDLTIQIEDVGWCVALPIVTRHPQDFMPLVEPLCENGSDDCCDCIITGPSYGAGKSRRL
jgi:hypothetical protein